MRDGTVLLKAVALLALTLSCGEVVTPPVPQATQVVPTTQPTTYVPPTVIPAVTQTEYAPPPAPPTATAFVPTYIAAAGAPTATPTLFLPDPIIPQIISYISLKYASLGGADGVLGPKVGDQQMTPDGVGYYQTYQRGVIYFTKETEAHEVHGEILAKWAELGLEKSFLGYPLTDEISTPDGIGRFNHFQGGSIYWTPDTGAHEVHGNILVRWSELGWENSCLGYPISDEEAVGSDSRQSRFQHGVITWSPSQGVTETCY